MTVLIYIDLKGNYRFMASKGLQLSKLRPVVLSLPARVLAMYDLDQRRNLFKSRDLDDHRFTIKRRLEARYNWFLAEFSSID